MMKEVYIFDIDGCVMEPNFPNLPNSETQEKIVEEAIHNGNGIKLYPDFIKYYKKFCSHAESIFFVTGRKKSDFGELTEKQLKPLVKLKNFNIIYYPESKPFNLPTYFEWKLKEIKKILKSSLTENYTFYIFDDMDDHFPKLRKIAKKYDIRLQLKVIENEMSWS
ncbi:MAG: hypothetical protein ACW97V_17890 [Promethearchaeota archaeon]